MPLDSGCWIEEFMVSGCYLIGLVSVVGAFVRVLADFPPWKSLSLIMIQRMPENLAGCYGGVHPMPYAGEGSSHAMLDGSKH